MTALKYLSTFTYAAIHKNPLVSCSIGVLYAVILQVLTTYVGRVFKLDSIASLLYEFPYLHFYFNGVDGVLPRLVFCSAISVLLIGSTLLLKRLPKIFTLSFAIFYAFIWLPLFSTANLFI